MKSNQDENPSFWGYSTSINQYLFYLSLIYNFMMLQDKQVYMFEYKCLTLYFMYGEIILTFYNTFLLVLDCTEDVFKSGNYSTDK